MLCCCLWKRKKPVLISSVDVVIPEIKHEKQFLLPCKQETHFDLINETKHVSRIDIINDKDIKNLTFRDCMIIQVLNCPKIQKIPCIRDFTTLETLRIQHCDISSFNLYIPNNVRVLEISYSGLKDFSPENLPNALADLNLSFNKLKQIPTCLENLTHAALNLKNNDFWFNMYSDISPAMICGEIIPEVILAHKLHLLSTAKILYAIKILQQKDLFNEARVLQKATKVEIEVRRKVAKTTAENAQNVHLTSIQDGMINALEYVNNYVAKTKYDINDLRCLFSREDWDKVEELCSNSTKHSMYKLTYKEALYNIVGIICDSPHKHTMLAILHEELIEGLNTCFTGQITRMVNSLNGFIKQVRINISSKEELSNSIIALRKKYSMMYTDLEEYTNETIPAVWQMLEDMCVPENEHMSWLEYV